MVFEQAAVKTAPAILVVEDERVIARDLEASLRMMGYNVIGTTATGEDCLERADARRPDLVLMDVRLAGALDGIETAEQLQARFDIPVVYLTAYADEHTVARARDTSPQGYVVKPFRAGELRSAIEIALFKHRAEARLKERERWFSTTLRAIADAVIAVDGSGQVKFMNRSAEVLTGAREENARGRPLGDVLRLIDEQTRKPIADPVRAALTGRAATRLPQNTAITTDLHELPIEDSVAPIIDDAGSLLGAVIVFRDVSEVRQRDEQIALADRMASLGVLAAGVGHEINNPLTYVLANASTASSRLGRIRALVGAGDAEAEAPSAIMTELAEVESMMDEIEHGATRIRRIVSDLRVFARPEAASIPGDVLGALEWALRVSETHVNERARLIKDLRPVPPVALGDSRLGQVFLNLVMNAAQAVPSGDPERHSITISTDCDVDGTILVRFRDTGSGMPREVVKRIFEPFFTTKSLGEGTGLGLSICHGIVRSMGGDILVESAPGKGSTFTVRLPLAAATSVRAPASSLRTSVRARVLVIDDEPLLGAAIARMLRSLHHVEATTSAEGALDILGREPPFDVILCDIVMPSMNGMDLYRELAARDPRLARRMVFISGGAFSQRVVDFLESVPNEHLVKPFTAANLNDFIQTFVQERDAELTSNASP
jgi:PAS domain S-box-containing protein